MSNSITIDSSKGPVAIDLSKLGEMLKSFTFSSASPQELGLAATSWMADTFPTQGVTIDGVTFKLTPIDISKFDFSKLNFGNVQLFSADSPIWAGSSDVTLQASSESVWQVPSAEAGSFIELNMAAIDLAGIGFATVEFNTLTF
jgi:hypothetical protein